MLTALQLISKNNKINKNNKSHNINNFKYNLNKSTKDKTRRSKNNKITRNRNGNRTKKKKGPTFVIGETSEIHVFN